MNDRVIWITGASSGIGEQLAELYASRGWKVIISARRREKLDALQQRLGDAVFSLPMDVSDFDALPALVDNAVAKWGRIDILINNAGISQRSRIEETRFSVYRRLMDVNYFGGVRLVQLVLPHMRSRNGGTIAAVSSVIGKFATPLRSGYAASKMAMQGFYDALRAEVWQDHIQVSLIIPGYIRTEISMNALSADGSKHGVMDQGQVNGMNPGACAEIIYRGLEKGKREIYAGINSRSRLGMTLARYAPGILARKLRSADVTS